MVTIRRPHSLVLLLMLAACDGPVEGGDPPGADAGDGKADDAADADVDTPEADADVPEPAELSWQKDSSANSSRTFYGDRVGRGVFDVRFTTSEAGEKRWVQGVVNIEQVDSASADPLMMAAVSISCGMVGGDKDRQNGMANTQNVIRGTPLRLEPQLVFVGGEPGEYRCVLSAQGGRPRPNGSFDATRFQIESGSLLQVSSPVHEASAKAYAPTQPSIVLDDGEAHDAAALSWTAPEGVETFTAFGSVKLTACTAVGGSDDPYDDLPSTGLCGLPEHEIDFGGTDVTAAFQVRQQAVGGGYCAEHQVPAGDAQVHVSKDTHHEQVYRVAAAIPVSTAPDCTRDFRIKTYVKQRSGASIVVHKQGTISAVIPH